MSGHATGRTNGNRRPWLRSCPSAGSGLTVGHRIESDFKDRTFGTLFLGRLTDAFGGRAAVVVPPTWARSGPRLRWKGRSKTRTGVATPTSTWNLVDHNGKLEGVLVSVSEQGLRTRTARA